MKGLNAVMEITDSQYITKHNIKYLYSQNLETIIVASEKNNTVDTDNYACTYFVHSCVNYVNCVFSSVIISVGGPIFMNY